MQLSYLEQFLVGEVFTFLLIFCRVGSGVMLLPGFGEAYVSPRIRLLFAMMMSLVLTPVVGHQMPEVPGSPLTMGVMVIAEILIGIFLGFLARLLVSTLHVAGTIISMQSSLAMASMFDMTMATQSTVLGNLLTMTALIVFFGMDLHHVMLDGLADSYVIFTPGTFPLVEDMSDHLFQTMGRVFTVAIQLSAPHIVFSLLFYLGAGVLTRLMPSMQVFFVFMPAQIVMGFFLMMAMLSSIIIYYSQFVQDMLSAFME